MNKVYLNTQNEIIEIRQGNEDSLPTIEGVRDIEISDELYQQYPYIKVTGSGDDVAVVPMTADESNPLKKQDSENYSLAEIDRLHQIHVSRGFEYKGKTFLLSPSLIAEMIRIESKTEGRAEIKMYAQGHELITIPSAEYADFFKAFHDKIELENQRTIAQKSAIKQATTIERHLEILEVDRSTYDS